MYYKHSSILPNSRICHQQTNKTSSRLIVLLLRLSACDPSKNLFAKDCSSIVLYHAELVGFSDPSNPTKWVYPPKLQHKPGSNQKKNTLKSSKLSCDKIRV